MLYRAPDPWRAKARDGHLRAEHRALVVAVDELVHQALRQFVHLVARGCPAGIVDPDIDAPEFPAAPGPRAPAPRLLWVTSQVWPTALPGPDGIQRAGGFLHVVRVTTGDHHVVPAAHELLGQAAADALAAAGNNDVCHRESGVHLSRHCAAPDATRLERHRRCDAIVNAGTLSRHLRRCRAAISAHSSFSQGVKELRRRRDLGRQRLGRHEAPARRSRLVIGRRRALDEACEHPAQLMLRAHVPKRAWYSNL